MPEVQTYKPENESIINISPSATEKLRKLIEEEENPNLMLRVFVTGGGCSGFQYGFTFEDEKSEDDYTFTEDGVNILVDPMSFQYLSGSTINYTESMLTSQFIIDNPHAKSTCGCGSSFGI